MKETTSKEKILKAACTLFARKGFNGVATQDVATLAGTNHSLIFHYFKNKEGLWSAVKEYIEQEYSSSHSWKFSTTESFDQFLKKLIHHYVGFYETNPEIQQIFSWQKLEFSSSSKQEHPLPLTEDFITLCNCLREYQRRGDIDESLDPRYITLYVLSSLEATVQALTPFISTREKNSYLSFFKNRLKRGLR